MHYLILYLFLVVSSLSLAQSEVDWNNYDADQLNEYITIEVNKLRRKARVDTLHYQPLLLNAAQDHVAYMLEKNVLTHHQKNKQKKTPKNRVDFYGEQFATVGENVQVLTLNSIPKQFRKKGEPQTINSYELMAKILVLNWKNSPPHFANMIRADYSGTLTAIRVGSDGAVYACQLLANEPFNHPKKDDALNFRYKPDNRKLIPRKNDSLQLRGTVHVLEDKSIYFSSHSKKKFKKNVRNPWRSGIAADIVLKSQYICATTNAFNGKRGVRGIPMNPVFRKSFRKGDNMFRKENVYIYLGKVPDWIDEAYEVNLTIVKKKRTFTNHKFDVIPLAFKLDLDIQPIVDVPFTELYEIMRDTITIRVPYEKSDTSFDPESFNRLLLPYTEKMNNRSRVLIRGFSSIEGSREINEKLYLKRAENLATVLRGHHIDSAAIQVSSAENIAGFRKDIKGTRFEFLDTLDDEELKQAVTEKWSDSLEPILKHHRYAELTLRLQWNDTIGMDPDRLKQLFDQSIQQSDFKQAGLVFNNVLHAIQKGMLDTSQLAFFELPQIKEFTYQQFQKLLLTVQTDTSAQVWWDEKFMGELYQLVLLDERQPEVKSYYYWLLYHQAMTAYDPGTIRAIFENLTEQKNINAVLKARMLLSLASRHDEIMLWYGGAKQDDYLHQHILPVYKKAGLTPDEMIYTAQYFYYFGYYPEVKSLLRRGISEHSSIEDIVTYLKIMNDSNMGLSEKQYVNLFVQVAEWKKEEFCTLFNSPKLNFQVMDIEQIKELYCEKCSTP